MPLTMRAGMRLWCARVLAGACLVMGGGMPVAWGQPWEGGDGAGALAPNRWPANVQRLADVPYGADPRQRMDVYLPPAGQARGPVLVMVHGGAWMFGHKAAAGLLENKLAHWVAQRGFVLVSLDYRIVPQATPLEQARDVAHAVAAVQAAAPGWGGDPARLVLMGHSAGAHLVAWLGASPRRAQALGVRPWKATVMLDSAALDVPALMARRHAGLYDRAFGSDPAAWLAMSPAQGLEPGAPPMLLVCSLPRRDDSCGQSRRFASQAQTQGLVAEVVPQNLSHRDINTRLGEPGAYTDAVDGFLRRQGAD